MPIEELKGFLFIGSDGRVHWTSKSFLKRGKNTLAGKWKQDGYREITIQGRKFLEHRVIWALHYGEWPTQILDHINGMPGDNRIENLRQVSNGQNQLNKLCHRNGRMAGVTFHKLSGKWLASVPGTLLNPPAKVKKYLGTFESQEAAGNAIIEYCRGIK